MSGLGQPRTTGTNFIKVKNHKFYRTTDKECETPYISLSGVLTSIYVKEESFDGKTFEKLYLGIQAEEEHFTLGLSTMGDTWAMLISFLKNADLRDSIELQVAAIDNTYMKDGKQVTTQKTMIFVKQNGQSLKSFFKKGTENELPAWEKVNVGKKTMLVKDAWEDALKAHVVEMNSIVGGNTPQPRPNTPSQPQTPPPSPVETPNFAPEVSGDDLPF